MSELVLGSHPCYCASP